MLRSNTRLRHVRALLSTVAVASMLTGCAALSDRLKQLGEPPPLSPVDNPTAKPGYKPVQMPMPTPQPVDLQSQFALAQRLARVLQRSARASVVGDILTVKVNINDTAQFPGSDPASAAPPPKIPAITNFIGANTHRQSGQGGPAGLGPDRQRQFADERPRHDQPAGSVGDQRRRGGHAGAAERQHGDRRQAGSPAQLGNARTHRRRCRAAGGHRKRQHHRTCRKSPRRASPMAAAARSPTFRPSAGASRRWILSCRSKRSSANSNQETRRSNANLLG